MTDKYTPEQLNYIKATAAHETSKAFAKEADEIFASHAFGLLQQGMKDRDAFRICATLVIFDKEAWKRFDKWAKEHDR